MKAAIYCRISRDDGTALGVARQEADCRALCLQRGWDDAEVIVDNDVSAYSGRRREGYERLLDGVRSGVFTAVVMWHPDRLHRRPLELEEFIDLVEATGVEVASVTTGDWDLSSSEGRLMARIVGSVARKESEDKSRRLRRKHLELAEAGMVSGGGRRPFGFDVDKVTIREDEAVEIRAAAERVVAGESLRSIAMDWQRRGVKTVTGVHWSPTTVRRLLTSARISGQREHNGRLSDAVWPAIVSADDLARVRARLSRPASASGRTPRKYLLTGVLYCGRCSALMTTGQVRRGETRFNRYVCSADRGGCGRCGIHGDLLEAHVVATMLDQLDSPQLADAVADTASPDPGPARELALAEERSVELAEMFAGGEIGRSEWLAARDRLEGRLSALRRLVNSGSEVSAVAALVGQGEVLRAQWPELALGRRRAVVDATVDRIVLSPPVGRSNVFDPGRVSIEWRL